MNTEHYTDFFETINEHTSVLEFEKIYAHQVYFKDPFHQTQGINALFKIFQEMYRRLEHPRFEILESVAEDTRCYVKWRFIFSYKGDTDEHSFEGVSRLELNEEKKIISHIDYWDAAENLYEQLPILGFILRFIKRKIAKR